MFSLEFSYAATEKSFQQVFLTLNSFSNNTYTSYTYMHIHRYEYIYISFVQVIAFCGVGYFKGLKHSIFKSCHQIPTSVLGTWCYQLFTVCCLFKNVKYFSKNVIFGRSKAQKLNLCIRTPSMWNVLLTPTSFIPSPRTPELGLALEFGFLSLWC